MSILSARASAGQVLVAGFPQGELPRELAELAAAGALGGYILFRRNLGTPVEICELLGQLAASCPDDRPPWLGVDQEGGRVARLGPPVVRLPAMRRLGDLNQPALTRRAATLLGRQLRHYGYNLDFAPVLDVDTNPQNPVIGDRAFGSTAAQVIAQAGAFARGLSAAGIVACGKHFPGHGDTAEDSHLALPRLPHALSRLREIELAPFAALGPDLPCMMSAHVIFDALDAARPATLSAVVISQVLRGELGYRGLVFSDDLEMKAISGHFGLGEAACAAIEAGCDTLLVCSNPAYVMTIHEALTLRAERDAGFAQRLQTAALRSLAARRQCRPAPAASHEIEARLRAEQPERLEDHLAALLEHPRS